MAKREFDRLTTIERSIIKGSRSHLWSPFTKALKEYKLVEENDKICVCISGGKDSMLLAKLFQELHRHPEIPFDVEYVVMDPGYNNATLNQIKENLEILNIPAKIIPTDIFEIANAADKKPCYLCARMRRGALYGIASRLGCNKIALGHHFDDVIETTLMSLFNNGAFETMLPKLHSENYEGMELIRPMYLIREKDIINWSRKNDLHFIRCACKFTEGLEEDTDLVSKRNETKELIHKLEKENPLIVKNIFKAGSNVNLDKVLGYKKDNEYYNYLDNYNKTNKGN